MSSADNLCKQFGPRSGATKCRAWSGSKLFDTLMVFLKEFFEKVAFEKSQQTTKKHAKLLNSKTNVLIAHILKAKTSLLPLFFVRVFLSFHLSRSQRKNTYYLFLYFDSTIMSSSIPPGQTWLMTMTYMLPSIKGTFVVSSDKTWGSWLCCQPCHNSIHVHSILHLKDLDFW